MASTVTSLQQLPLSILLILGIVSCAHASMTFLSNPIFNGTKATASWGVHETIVGTVAYPLSPFAYGGIILAPPLPGFQSYISILHFIQQNLLPKAIVMIQVIPGPPGYDQLATYPFENITVPVISIEVSALDIFFALNGTNIIIPVIIEHEPNIWYEVSWSGLWFAGQYLIVAAQLTGMILCIVRFVQFLRGAGRILSTAIVSLVVCFVSTCLSVVWWAADPAWSSRGYTLDTHFVLSTSPFSLTLVLLFISTFYWHELITLTQISVKTFIQGFRIPFLVVSLFILAFEYLVEVCRVSLGGEPWVVQLVTAFNSILAAVYILSIAYFMYVTISVACFLKKKSIAADRLRTTTARMGTNIFGAILVLVAIFLSLANLTFDPYGIKYSFWLGYAGVSIVNICIPLGLLPPTASKITSSRMTATGNSSA